MTDDPAASMQHVTEDMRERIATILESIARDGLQNPRDLDVALDAIGEEVAAVRRAVLDEAAAVVENLAAQTQAEADTYAGSHASYVGDEQAAVLHGAAAKILTLKENTDGR